MSSKISVDPVLKNNEYFQLFFSDEEIGKGISSLKELGLRYNIKNQLLCNASIGQIMLALSRVNIRKNNKNEYEKVLSRWFTVAIPAIVKKYVSLFYSKSSQDYDVRWYNLAGFLPKGINIFPKEHSMLLSKANLGNLLKAINQRLNFILDREPPKMYLENETLLFWFRGLRTDLRLFEADIKKFNDAFVAIIDYAIKTQKQWYFEEQKRQEEYIVRLEYFIDSTI